MFPDEAYSAKGLAAPKDGKLAWVSLRIASPQAKNQKEVTGETIEGERALLIQTISGLKYDKTLIEAKSKRALGTDPRERDAMPTI